jgi:Mrp family chromosome partitioning ATPase
MGYQFLDGAPTNAPPSFVQGVTNSGNPGAAAVSAALAVEVQQNNATLVLLNGDITYAECAAAPHVSVALACEGCDHSVGCA